VLNVEKEISIDFGGVSLPIKIASPPPPPPELSWIWTQMGLGGVFVGKILQIFVVMDQLV